MINGILVNLSFLVSFLCIGILVFHKYRIARRTKQRQHFSSFLLGIFDGCMGIVLMIFAARTGNGTAVDFHCVAILLAAVWGGVLPLVLCAALQILYMVLSSGFGMATVCGAGTILFTAAASGLVVHTKLTQGKKWALCTALFIPIASIEYLPLLSSGGFWNTLTAFSAALLPVSALSYDIVRTAFNNDALIRRLRRESARDYLTGLNNVRKFDKMYNIAVRSALNRRQSLSLLMCDIDFFKKVNDRYGHRNGDAILVQLSGILQRNFPRSVISRNGGEEFTVLLRNRTEPQALAEAERLRADVEHSGFALLDGSEIRITISVGVASCLHPGEEADRLLERADTALYMAKRGGRNKVAAAHSGGCQSDAEPSETAFHADAGAAQP